MSHNNWLRKIVSVVGITLFIAFLFTFHLESSNSIWTNRVQEKPFFDEQQSHISTSPKKDYQQKAQNGYHSSLPDRGDGASLEGKSDYRLLTSLRNNMGFYNKIDARQTGYQIMNPTVLELPRGGNSSHDFLVIARTKHIAKNIHRKQYQLARQVATFANLTYDSFGRPLLKTGKWSKLLVEDFGDPEHHCKGQPNIDKYIGPEDMKLFWTRTGEPLLIFTHQVNDKNMCQGQFLIDVRAALVELEQVLGPEFSSLLPPIRFASPAGLRRGAPPGQENHPRYQREKNWAPGQSPFGSVSELLLMAEPGQLFRWISNDEPVELVLGAKDQRSAVEEPYPATAKPGETWHSRKSMTCVHDVMLHDEHVHQSTPMLTLTLCHRGSCEPDRQNTVMLGMVQRRQDPPAAPFTWYDRRIAVYESSPPYSMLSVSKKLTYHGETDSRYIWTGSMSYYTNHTEFPPPNHGFLDDEIWLGFGVNDAAAGWLDIRASELVADHYLCQGAPAEYRYYRQNSLA